MKKILCFILCVFMLTGMVVKAQEPVSISVTVTVSKYGEFILDKNNEEVICREIVLSEKEEYSLNDVFLELHNEYFEGEEGYVTEIGDYGEYVTKFWGDESQNFIYQVNFGTEDVWGPTHIVNEGDNIDFVINKSYYPDTESYTKFKDVTAFVYEGNEFEFVLEESSYTAEGLEFSPCADAVLTINGEPCDVITDAEGKAVVSFEEKGIFIVSAQKTKVVDEETVTAITAPYCIVTVEEKAENTVVENIIAKYLNESIVNDGNFCWFIADFADYISFNEDKSFSSKMIKASVDKLVELGENAETQGDIAKTIIALRALGYDARKVYNKNSIQINLVEKLTNMITPESVNEPYYEYTLPYVLMALQQGEDYASAETIEFLLETALNTKDAWQDTSWGTDGATPMLRALAPYCNEREDVRLAVEEAVDLIKAFQGESGTMGGAASTGLAIAGLTAVNVNPYDVAVGENNLIDGLLLDLNEGKDGFVPDSNSFSTEQGLRGLISLKLYDMGRMIYDFAEYPMNEARATVKTHAGGGSGGGGGRVTPVVKEEPKNEEKETEKENMTEEVEEEKLVFVPEEIYTERTFEDVKEHPNKQAIEVLAKRGIVNGMDGKNFCPSNTMTRAEFATIVVQALGLEEQQGKAFEDVPKDEWFFKYISTAQHHGIINGISETLFNPNGLITRQEAATMVVRAASLCKMETALDDDAVRNILAQFPDYTSSAQWAKESLAFCYNAKILDTSAEEIKPEENISRAEVAQMIYNMLIYGKLI